MKCLTRGGSLQQLGPPPRSPGDPPAAAASVDGIAHNRVPQVLEMHPNLMGPAGVQLQPEQVYHLESGHYRSVGAGRTALGGYTHALPVVLVPCDRRVDADRTGVQMAPRQRRVAPMHPARRDGGAEPPVGKIGFGDDHEPGRIPVEPMDDSGPPFGASGEGGAPGDQRIHQGVVPMAGRRMNYQTGRLVDDGEVLVLENEREGNGRRLERSGGFVVRDLNRYDLAPGKAPGSPSEFSIDGHTLVCHEARGLSPGDGHLVGEKPIEALGFQTNNGEFDFVSGIRLGLSV